VPPPTDLNRGLVAIAGDLSAQASNPLSRAIRTELNQQTHGCPAPDGWLDAT
jgi:hypothetical protein